MCTVYRASLSTHSEDSCSLLFIPCLQKRMLLTSAFPKEDSAISLEEWVLVFKVFTTATRVCLFVGWLLNVPATG